MDGGHKRQNKKGMRYAKSFNAVYGKYVMNAHMLEVSIRSRNGAPARKGCVVNAQMTKASNK